MAALIDLKIAPGVRLTAESPADLLEFIEKEREFWKPTKDIRARHNSMLHRAVAQQQQHLDRLLQVTREWAGDPARSDYADMVQHELRLFLEGEDGGRALCSLNPRDAAVLMLKDVDPDAAAAGMAARLRHTDIQRGINDHDKAELILALGRYSVATASPLTQALSFTSHGERVEASLKQWRSDVTGAVEKATKATGDSTGALAEFKKQVAADHKAHEDMLAEHDKAVQEQVKKYMTELTLLAPVQYWNDLAGKGKFAASLWLIVFVVISGGLFMGITRYGPDLLTLLKDSKGDVSLAATPLLVAAVIPLFWVLKHVARLFADNVADGRDAKQRANLTSTFLALTAKEGVTFTEAERAIIVQALFRPSPAQPVDDGVPVPVLELLKR